MYNCPCCGEPNTAAEVEYFFCGKPQTRAILCFPCADERPIDAPTHDDDIYPRFAAEA